MNRKLKKQIFFFSISFLLFLSQTTTFISFSKGFDPETTTIKAEWLSVTTSGFVDTSPHSWEDDISINIGGEDLLEFENLGIVTTESDDTRVVYKSRVKLGFEVSASTSVDYRKIYPNANLQAQYSQWFFGLNRYKISGAFYTHYDVSWTYFDFGDTLNVHDYKGFIPITVGMKELTGTSGSMTINGETLATPEYISDILQTKVEMVRSKPIGVYTDVYDDINDITEGIVEFDVQADLLPDQQNIVDWYKNAGIGWSAGDIERGQTLQQSIVAAAKSTYHNPNPAVEKSYTFNLGMEIQPEVFEIVQYNTITKASIILWEWGFWAGNIDTVYGPSTESVKRTIGVHPINQELRWDLTLDAYIYATIPSTAELTTTILEDPYLRMGDFVWDTSITGDYDVKVPITAEPLLLGLLDILFWIIVIAVIILVIWIFAKIGIPLILRKNAKQKYRY